MFEVNIHTADTLKREVFTSNNPSAVQEILAKELHNEDCWRVVTVDRVGCTRRNRKKITVTKYYKENNKWVSYTFKE